MLRSALKLAVFAAVSVAAAPQFAAAQSFYDDGPRPYVLRTQDDIAIEGDRARVERRQEFGPRGGEGYRAPRVVYDQRDRFRPSREGWRDRDDDGGRPAYRHRRPAGDDDAYRFAPPADGPRDADRPRAGYRPTAFVDVDAAPVGPVPGAYAPVPDVGCTIQQTQAVTPAGWRKIVTHRVCYRR